MDHHRGEHVQRRSGLVFGQTAGMGGLLGAFEQVRADLRTHVREQRRRAVLGQEGVARLNHTELDQAPEPSG
jgi:hypothetical protein